MRMLLRTALLTSASPTPDRHDDGSCRTEVQA
jgi:hypothetical protein